MCNLVQIVTPMRPQLFSFALLAVATYLVVSFMDTRRVRYLAGYPLMMAAWVNLHGGFIVGLLLLGLMATGLTVEAVISRRIKDELRTLVAAWSIVGASLLATFLNPYGVKAIHTVIMIGGLRSSSVISEWMPVNLTTELGWFYLLNLVPFVALMAISGCRPRLTHAFGEGERGRGVPGRERRRRRHRHPATLDDPVPGRAR